MSEVRGDYPKISTGHPDAGRAFANALDSSLAREAKLLADFDRVTAEREALQIMLNDLEEQNHNLEQRRQAEQQACQAAERRVGELSEALKNMIAAFDTPIRRRKLQSEFNEEAIASAYAALNPTAEAVIHE